MPTIEDQIRADLANLPAAGPSIEDQIRSDLGLQAPRDREQAHQSSIERDIRNDLLSLGRPVSAPQLGRGEPRVDPPALNNYFGLQIADTTNPAKRTDFALSQLASFRQQFPNVYQILGSNNVFSPSPGATDTALDRLTSTAKRGAEVGYWLQHGQASGEETRKARTDALKDWTAGGLVQLSALAASGVKGAGREITPVQLGRPPDGINEADFHELISRTYGLESRKATNDPTFLASLTENQRRLADAIRLPDFIRFLDRREKDYVSWNRLETLTGQPRDRTPKLVELHGEDEEASRLAGRPAVPAFNFQLPMLAPIDPAIREWAQLEQTYRQTSYFNPTADPRNTLGGPSALNLAGPLQALETTALRAGTALMSPEQREYILKRAEEKPTFENMDALVGAINPTIAAQSPRIIGEAFFKPIEIPAYAVAPLFTAVGGVASWTIDHASSWLVGPNITDRVSHALFRHTVGAIAPHLSIDAANDEAFAARVLDRLPADISPDEVRILTQQLLPPLKTMDQVLLNTPLLADNPYIRDQVGGFIGAMGDSGGALIASLIGFVPAGRALGAITSAVKGPNTFLSAGSVVPRAGFFGKVIDTASAVFPRLKQRALDYDFTSQTGAAGAVAREAIISRLNTQVASMETLDDAVPLLNRTMDLLNSEQRGVDATDYGVLQTKLADIQARAKAQGDAPLKPSDRQALFDTIHPLTALGPTEALFAATGNIHKFGAAETARVTEKLLAATERFIKGEGPASPLLRGWYAEGELHKLTEQIAEVHQGAVDAAAKRDRLSKLVADTADQIQNRGAARGEQVSALHRHREQVINSMNDDVENALKRVEEYDTNGGIRYKPAENPQYPPIEVIMKQDLTPERAQVRKRIAEKVENARAAGEIVALSSGERAVLNSVLNTPLDFKKTHDSIKAISADIKKLREGTNYDTDRLRLLSDFHTRLQSLPLEPGAKVGIPSKQTRLPGGGTQTISVADVIRDELGNSSQDLTGTRFIPIHAALKERTLTALQALDELQGRFREDLRPVNTSLKKLAALDLAVAFNAGHGDLPWLTEKLYRDAADYETFQLHQARRLSALFGKELTFSDGIQLMKDRAEGKIHSPELQKLEQEWREGLVRDAHAAGILDDAQVRSYLGNERYYHGFFPPDTLARLEPPQVIPIPSRWSRLKVTQAYANGKIPETEGGWHVTWDQGGKAQYEEFPTAAAAQDWLATGGEEGPKRADGRFLKPGSAVDIRPNMTFSNKVLKGLVGDPSLSIMDLGRQFARDTSRAMLAQHLSRTPLVRTAAQVAQDSAFKLVTDGVLPHAINETDGKIWLKVTNPEARFLTGKYVSQDVIRLMRLHDVGGKFWEEFAKVVQGNTGLFDAFTGARNPLLSRTAQFLNTALGAQSVKAISKILTVPAAILALSKVALSPASWIRQWHSNIFIYARAAGLETLDPTNWPTILKYFHEGSAAMAGKTDAFLDDLMRSGTIHASKSAFYRTFADRLKTYRTDADALGARREFLLKEADRYSAMGDHAKAVEFSDGALNLEKELTALAPKQFGHVLNDALDGFHHWMANDFFGNLKNMTRRLNEASWDIFATADNISKYATYRYLREVKGLTRDAALERIDTFMQSIHRVPPAIKQLSGKYLGAQFVAFPYDQYRIMLNTFMQRPVWAVGNMALLASWNRLQLGASGQDPNDALNTWAALKFGRRRDALTDATFLLSRILFPGGRGGIDLAPAGLDTLYATSPFGRLIQRSITKADLPSYAKIALSTANGIASKFVFGGVTLNAIANLYKQTDNSGKPYANIWDSIVDQIKNFAYPAIASDAEHYYKAASGRDYDTFDGRQRTIEEFMRTRYGNLIARNELSDEHLVWALAHATLDTTREHGTFMREHGEESLKDKLWASDAYLGNGKWDRAKARAVMADWSAEHQKFYDGWNGTDPKKVDPEKAKALLKTAELPRVAELFDQLTLSERLQIYTTAKSFKHRWDNPAFESFAKKSMLKDTGPTANISKTSMADLRAIGVRARTDPNLPADAHQFVNRILGQANLRRYEIEQHTP